MRIPQSKRQKPAAEVFTGGKCERKNPPPEASSIDMLPDEVLVMVLSCLTLKEAARASVLSRRWRFLWRFSSSDIVFELQRRNAEDGSGMELSDSLNLVNQVMALHQGPSVDKLVISFSTPPARDSPDILPFRDWILFAMQKKVQVLELPCFGYNFLGLDKFLSISRAKEPQSSLASLNSFTLVGFNIKDDTIEYLLSICPNLEHLSFKGGKFPNNLAIVSPSLKSLSIRTCGNLDRLTISAVNLVSFTYMEHSWVKDMPEFCFEHVPLLSEAIVDGQYMYDSIFLPGHKVYYDQLVKLVLTLSAWVITAMANFCTYHVIPRLRHLKHLELVITVLPGASLLFYVFWVMASPVLSTLSVQFSTQTLRNLLDMNAIQIDLPKQRKCAQKQLMRYRHNHLKQVTLIDFVGHESNIEFVMDLLEIAKSLEKLVIHPKGDVNGNGVGSIEDYVKQIEAKLPAGAELVIQ